MGRAGPDLFSIFRDRRQRWHARGNLEAPSVVQQGKAPVGVRGGDHSFESKAALDFPQKFPTRPSPTLDSVGRKGTGVTLKSPRLKPIVDVACDDEATSSYGSKGAADDE